MVEFFLKKKIKNQNIQNYQERVDIFTYKSSDKGEL